MELTLISSNIRFDNPVDLENSWIHRREFLSKTLLSHAPDVIATQEGRFDQLLDFQTLLKDYAIVDQHRSWIKARMYPTIFLKKNRFEILWSQDIWLSETPEIAGSSSFESAFPRLMSIVKLQPRHSRQKFLIVNCHLDHIKQQTRTEQVRVLTEQIKKIYDDEFLIVMGDFNDAPESEVRQSLLRELPLLQDSWLVCNQHEETSHHGFLGKNETGHRIDWILTDQRLQVVSADLDRRSENGKYPSDHFPMVTKIKA